MSIVRVQHDKENPYVTLNKHSLWDKELSLAAVGIWARLLSRPDDWVIRTSELCKSCGVGKDKMRSLLNELMEAGYCFRYRPTKSNGQFEDWITVVFESKKTKQEIKKMFPETEKPALAKAALVKSPLLNKEDNTKEEDVCVTRAHARAEHVSTTDEEHSKLLSTHGPEKTALFYKRLSEWKKDTPESKWKKNDYRSILRWVVQAETDAEIKRQGNEKWKKKKYQTKSTNSKPTYSEGVTREQISRTSASLAEILKQSENG